jgi:NADPH:quinone reductase-like Zn-dependent oxidoreductase
LLAQLAASGAHFDMLRLCLTLVIAVTSAGGVAAQSRPSLMHAIVAHAYGGPEVLKYETIARPEPKDDQILIRVIAAAINPVDAAVRRGSFKDVSGEKFPLIPGYDVSGIVEKTGANARKFKVNDAVYAFLSLKHGGGYAEYATADENEASLKPKSITFEKAAAVPLAASTAWQALIDTAHLESGQTVLIHGGSGGVGSFGIQIAKAHGAKVIATASTANQDLLAQLSADQSIDYKTTKFEDMVKDADVVLDAVGGDTLKRSYDVVRKGGIIVSVAGQPDPAELKKRGIRGTWILVQPKANVLDELTKLIEAKKITPIVSAVVPLAEAAKAQEQVAARHTRGKIVLRVADEPNN